MSKYVKVDLSEYFNNCGISYVNDIQSGDLTGIGSSYPAEQLPDSNSNIEVDNVPFLFPKKEVGEKNNIEFNNQVISLPKGNYRNLFVLGAAENGSYIETLIIRNKNISQKIRLGLTDWLNETCEFNETIAYHCYGCHSTKAGIISTFEPKMWLQRIDLPENLLAEELSLPDNPGMHIFAITLEKEGEHA